MTAATGPDPNLVKLTPRHNFSIINVYEADGKKIIFLKDPTNTRTYEGSLKDMIDTQNPAT